MKHPASNIVASALLAVSSAVAQEPAKSRLELTVACDHLGEFGLVNFELESGKVKNASLLARGRLTAPAWSADGMKLAYVDENHAPPQIWVMNADGSKPIQLTRGEGPKYAPAWSPDGSKIAFHANPARTWDVCVMGSDGTDLAIVADDARYDGSPAWSPDGQSIAYESHRGGTSHVWAMSADGMNKRDLLEVDSPAGGVGAAPAWSPDGRMIALGRYVRDGSTQLFVAALSGNEMRQITRGGKINAFGAWSPDGRYIAYVHYDEWLVDGKPLPPGEIRLFDVVDENHTTIVKGQLPWQIEGRPSWKPLPKDGER